MSTQQFQDLQALIADTEKDFIAFYDKSNKAAGTRVRKAMQDIKNMAQDIRKEVTDIKNK